MSATRAYAQLSMRPARSLEIGAVRGLSDAGRLHRAAADAGGADLRSFSARLEDLSQRAAWTSELLRTRIDIALAKQNRDLLTSMDRRTQLQLRLQQTVEGLSVVAISYYLVALIGYLFGAGAGLEAMDDARDGGGRPVVLAVVALMVWRLRRHIRE